MAIRGVIGAMSGETAALAAIRAAPEIGSGLRVTRDFVVAGSAFRSLSAGTLQGAYGSAANDNLMTEIDGLRETAAGERASVPLSTLFADHLSTFDSPTEFPIRTSMGAVLSSRIPSTGASNHNGATAIDAADIIEICKPTSKAATRDAADRLTSALKAKSYWYGSRVAGREDVPQEVLLKILKSCEKILSGYYSNIPAFARSTVKNAITDLAREEAKARRLDTSILLDLMSQSLLMSGTMQSSYESQRELDAKRLTDNERVVALGLSAGLSTKQIAERIIKPTGEPISEARVREIKQQVLAKLGKPE